jgi:hypothetical protein
VEENEREREEWRGEQADMGWSGEEIRWRRERKEKKEREKKKKKKKRKMNKNKRK